MTKSQSKRIILMVGVLFMAIAMILCFGAAANAAADGDTTGGGVKVTGTTTVKVGSTTKLTLANYTGPGPIIWRSVNTDIATLTSNGNVATITGVKLGSTEITCTFSGATIRTTVKVTSGSTQSHGDNPESPTGPSLGGGHTPSSEIKGVILSYENSTMKVGETQSAKVTLDPEDCIGVTKSFRSSDSTIVYVNSTTGAITAKSKSSSSTRIYLTATDLYGTPKTSYFDIASVTEDEETTTLRASTNELVLKFNQSDRKIVFSVEPKNKLITVTGPTGSYVSNYLSYSIGSQQDGKVTVTVSSKNHATSQPLLFTASCLGASSVTVPVVVQSPSNPEVSVPSVPGTVYSGATLDLCAGTDFEGKTLYWSSPAKGSVKGNIYTPAKNGNYMNTIVGYMDSSKTESSKVIERKVTVYTPSKRVSSLTKAVNQTVFMSDIWNLNTTDDTERSKWSISLSRGNGDKGNGVKDGAGYRLTEPGKCNINLLYDKKSVGTFKITILDADGIRFKKTSDTMDSNKKYTATLSFSNDARNQKIIWRVDKGLKIDSSDNKKVVVSCDPSVFINNRDEVKTARIYAHCKDKPEYSASMELTIKRITKLEGIKEFSYSPSTIEIGQTATPSYKLNPVTAILNGTIRYELGSQADSSKIKVDAKTGVVTGLGTTKSAQTIKMIIKENGKEYYKYAKVSVVEDINAPKSWSISAFPNMLVGDIDDIGDYTTLPQYPEMAKCVDRIALSDYINISPENANMGKLKAVAVNGKDCISITQNGDDVVITALKTGKAKIKITNESYPKLKYLTAEINVKYDITRGFSAIKDYYGLVGTTVKIENLATVYGDLITMAGPVDYVENNGTSVYLKAPAKSAVINYYIDGRLQKQITKMHIYDVGFKKSSYKLDAKKTTGLDLDSLVNLSASKLTDQYTYAYKIIEGNHLAVIKGNKLNITGAGNGTVVVEVSARGTDKKGTTSIKISNVSLAPLNLNTSYTGEKGTTIGIDYFLNNTSGDWHFTESNGKEYVSITKGNDRSLDLKEVYKGVTIKMHDNYSGRNASVKVTVIEKATETIEVEGKKLGDLYVRKSKTTNIPKDGEWYSNNTDIAKIVNSTQVKGINLGNAKIINKRTNNYYLVHCVEISIKKSEVELKEGGSEALRNIIYDYMPENSNIIINKAKSKTNVTSIKGTNVVAGKIEDDSLTKVKEKYNVRYGTEKSSSAIGSFTVIVTK